MGRITLNLGLRYDQFIGETRESSVLPSRHERRRHVRRVLGRHGRSGRPLHGQSPELEGHLAARRLGDGRLRQRPHRAQGELRALRRGPADCRGQPGQPDRRADRDDTRTWTDLDGNGLPLDAAGNIQFNELGQLGVDADVRSPTVPTTQYDPDAAATAGASVATTTSSPIAMQHQLADRVSVNGGYYRRTFGNQTFTDDLRYDASSYDSFCITAPADPDLPGGGSYQVCGVQDLKPAVFAQNLPANSLIRFVLRLRRRDQHVSGVRPQPRGALPQRRVPQGRHSPPRAHLRQLQPAGGRFRRREHGGSFMGTETYPDGRQACRASTATVLMPSRRAPTPLPWDIQVSGTYQFSRGIQTGGGAGPSQLANWSMTSAQAQPFTGRAWTGVARASSA